MDWEAALNGLHNQIGDVRDDISNVRIEVRDLGSEQKSTQDQLAHDRAVVKELHKDYLSIRDAVNEISTAQRLASQNATLMQRLNDQTNRGLEGKYDKLYASVERHASRDEDTRKKLLFVLISLVIAMVGGFAGTAVMVMTKIADAL